MISRLVQLLTQAIEDRLQGNCGIVVSGGLDSSTVAVLSPQELPTFSAYYDDPSCDERQYSRLVSHPQHHEILITPQDFVDNFALMVPHLRPPIMGMGTFGQFMLAKYVSQYVDVVLSGEGSDELFGGYVRLMMVAGESPPQGYEDYQLPEGYPTNLAEALWYDLARLPDLLAVDDQMTSAWGIEARAPFTDQRILDYALSLPLFERVGKKHLRKAVRGIVPDQIIDRKDKMGFPIPLVRWANEEPVKSFALQTVGYLPDPSKPWDRGWWLDMVGYGSGLSRQAG